MTSPMTDSTSRTHPVDSGWAWVVLFGCTCNFALIVGTIKSFGIFFIEFLEMFDASVSMTSMIAGLMQVTYSFFSLPIMTIGLRYTSPRQSAIFGGLFATSAYALGSLAQNVNFLLFTHGILFGIAFGCIHGPSAYVIGQYFEKRRSLANACVTAGGSVGGLVLPPTFEILIETYGLRGALLLTSAIISHTLIGAMLLRPATSYSRPKKPDISVTNKNTETVGLIASGQVEHIKNESPQLSKKVYLRNFPITQSNLTENEADCQQKTLEHSQSPFGKWPNSDDKRDSNEGNHDKVAGSNIIAVESHDYVERIEHFKEQSDDTDVVSLASESNGTLKTARKDARYSSFASHADLFTASLTDVSQMQASADFTGHRANDGTDDENSDKHSCLSVIHIDFSLLKNPVMVMFLFVYCLGSIGSAYGHIYIAVLARDVGISTSQITLLVSLLSGCDIVGRFICGIVVDRRWMTSSGVITLSVLITGIMMQLAYLFQGFWSMLFYSIIHGLFAGGIFALTPTILIDLLGFENFRSALGIAIFSQGFALAASAPFIGFLRDRTHTYVSSFQFMGGCMIIAGLVLLLKPIIIRLVCGQRSNDEQSVPRT
ncbi:monocarboxylate transporter 14-like [Pecten maximus]|uniref:monocarboxylate transporter 14-like n=1 Tax=Pecten maximus TaxID=6579 RepID=UPI001458D99C|nr:monocarboxylate transporter 14-like [Pecten maximus]